MESIKPYKKAYEYSYTLGAFPTYEMLKAMPECADEVYVHSSYTDYRELAVLCNEKRIPLRFNDKVIEKLSDKENIYVIGIFKKFECTPEAEKPHLVLVNPGNMGNMGTILRTAVGFGIKDVIIISPGTDIFNPKVVRASMGALFRLRHKYFDSFDEYRELYPKHEVFTFMLDGEMTLSVGNCPKPKLYALVFGNEATGLDSSYKGRGTSVIIPQSDEVDSLNLTIAAGIGMYLFSSENVI